MSDGSTLAQSASSTPNPNGDCEPKKPHLDDGRNVGEWRTRFDARAWCQITLELTFLIVLLAGGTAIIFDGVRPQPQDLPSGVYRFHLYSIDIKQDAVKWPTLWVCGMIGGTVFSLKWLYHSVAKGVWSRDRILWRVIVPFNSGTVAFFTGALFASGAIPFLNGLAFDNTLTLLGFGFIFGYFSDNILASMQNLAQRVFGTLRQGE